MLVAIEVEIDEFYCQVLPLGPDSRSLCIDAYRVSRVSEVDRYLAGNLRGRNCLVRGQANAAHADIDALLRSDDAVLHLYLNGGVEVDPDEPSFFYRPGNHEDTSPRSVIKYSSRLPSESMAGFSFACFIADESARPNRFRRWFDRQSQQTILWFCLTSQRVSGKRIYL
jgi:hypothetical protein